MTTTDGARIHYRVQGEKTAAPAVVFLNGFLQTALYWTLHARRLQHSRVVLTYDARGQGESGTGAEAPTWETHVSDLRALLERAGIERAVLVGLSMGACTAAAFAAAHPSKTAGCVLCSIGSGFARTGRPERWRGMLEAGGLEGLASGLMEDVFGSGFRRLAPRQRKWFVEGIVQRNRAEAVGEQLRALEDYWPVTDHALRLRTVPVRVVRGENDRLVTPGEAVALAAAAGTGVTTVPGAGHSFPAENPDGFASVLDPFLENPRTETR